jgi:hypothetical protein
LILYLDGLLHLVLAAFFNLLCSASAVLFFYAALLFSFCCSSLLSLGLAPCLLGDLLCCDVSVLSTQAGATVLEILSTWAGQVTEADHAIFT